MSTLHLVNHPPRSSSSLELCLDFVQPGDGLVLIEDGVYAALAGALRAQELRALARVTVFVLESDLEARSLFDAEFTDTFQRIDYRKLVTLVLHYDATVSWG